MRTAPHLPVLAALAVLLACGCTESLNYDIEEVAPAEFLSGEEEDCHDPECDGHDHGHDEGEHDAGVSDLEEGTGVHRHGAGVRNHGTQWFFNQPWAASFVWGKMLRDSIILVVLAALVLLLPRFARRR